MNLIKSRTAKTSDRGIYIQDPELVQTCFKVGVPFSYKYDDGNKLLIISIDPDSKRHSMAKRLVKGELRPVLDLKSKEAKAMFTGCTSLVISLYTDKIIVMGVAE